MSVLGESTFSLFHGVVDRKGLRMTLRLLVVQEVRTAAVASKERFLQSALAHELVADINAEKHAVRHLNLYSNTSPLSLECLLGRDSRKA